MKKLSNTYFVKNILIGMFVLQFASGHNLFAEILRLPSLIEHLAEHRAENPDISIADFLYLHYADQNHEHSDTRHEHLPLHCHHVLMAETIVYQPFSFFCESENTPTILIKNTRLFGEARHHFATPIFGFFRPPQKTHLNPPKGRTFQYDVA